MFIQGLDHFNIRIRPTDVAPTRHFYCDILGLKEGPRPQLSFPGIWLYCGDRPLVHVNITEDTAHSNTGAFDHVAFQSVGDPQMLSKHLDGEGIQHEMRTVSNGIRQVFCTDPNGVKVEFNFPPA